LFIEEAEDVRAVHYDWNIEDVRAMHPPLEQPKPSMADEFVASIFGDPNPGMASSSHKSLHHSTMSPFFDSSMYTGPGSHWAAPLDFAPPDDQ
jgi:hypothetical protein